MKLEVKKVKIYVTIPVEYVDAVRDAMSKYGAGIIGNYSHCSTSVKSVGTFKPNEDANPFTGKIGNLEFVEEEKLEMVCDVENVKDVMSALRKAHPYEEPAIDIVPLLDESDF